MTDADPQVYFSQRLRVVVHRATLRTVLRGLVITYPIQIISIAAIALFALVARTSALLGLILFPLLSLARAQMGNEKAARAVGVVPVKVDTTQIPEVASVKAGEGGLSVEGLNLTLSRKSLLRGAVDESGNTVFVETKRDLPNFTFAVDDHDEGKRLLAALGLLEGRTPTKAPIPELLKRGDLSSIAWLETLRAQDHTDYRASPTTPDALWRILEDPDAPLGARAAAGIALVPSLDKAGRLRMRRIKEDAPYRLRVALKAARGTNTAATVKALDACEDDDRSSRPAPRR